MSGVSPFELRGSADAVCVDDACLVELPEAAEETER